MKRKVFLVLIIFVSLSSCKKIIDSAAALGGEEELTIEKLKVISVEDKYSLSLPKYMTEMKSLNDDASLKYANIYKETYTIVIDEDKQEFMNAFKELEIYNDSLTPLENYSDYQMKSFKENMDDADYILLDSKIRSFESNQFEFTGKSEGINIKYLIGFVETDNDMFMLMSWTLKDRYKKYRNTFKQVQNSFKLK